jgi:hypothetical protein
MTGRVVSGDYHGKMRDDPLLLESRDSLAQPLLETECECLSVYDYRAHISPPGRLAL